MRVHNSNDEGEGLRLLLFQACKLRQVLVE